MMLVLSFLEHENTNHHLLSCMIKEQLRHSAELLLLCFEEEDSV